jgi:hypothetical protein
VEREGGAVPLLLDCEIVEEPTDVGEEEVADLGFVLVRRLDLGKRVFQIPVFIAKGSAVRICLRLAAFFPVSQEPIGFQGGGERKTPRIETCSRCPGKKPCPSALVGQEAVRECKIPRANWG